MAKKKEALILDDEVLENESESNQLVDGEGNEDVEPESDVVRIKYIGKNPSFTIGKIIFTPGSTEEIQKELAALALNHKGFQKVK